MENSNKQQALKASLKSRNQLMCSVNPAGSKYVSKYASKANHFVDQK